LPDRSPRWRDRKRPFAINDTGAREWRIKHFDQRERRLAPTLQFMGAPLPADRPSLELSPQADAVGSRDEIDNHVSSARVGSRGRTSSSTQPRVSLQRRDGPSLLALTRQSLPLLRREPGTENISAPGAYVLAESEGARQVTLLATRLRGFGGYRRARGAGGGGSALPWSRCLLGVFRRRWCWVRRHGLPSSSAGNVGSARAAGFIGITGFGASAPGEGGITPEKVAEAARSLL
jgi:hypothetical protein